MNGLFIVLVLGLLQACHCQKEILENRGVYTFQNRGDLGFLTTHLQSLVVDTDSWRDASSQKFRVVKGFVSTSYMLKPTSEEGEAIYVSRSNISKASSGFGMSSSQYWTVILAERGFYQIRNLQSEECLESHGLGQRVITRKCRNTPAQQWAVHAR